MLQPGGFSNPRSEGSQGIRLLHQELGASLSNLTLVFTSDRTTVDDPAYEAEVQRVLAPFSEHPRVERSISYYSTGNGRMASPDRHTTYALVGLDVPIQEAQRLVPELKALLPDSWLTVLVTGGAAAYADIEIVSHEDLIRAERVSLPLAAVLLLLIFGSVVAAGLPAVVGGISVLVTLSIVFFLGHVTDLSIFVQNISTMLGLGVSIDYALLIVSRFREELAANNPEAAVVRTMDTAGRAVFFSGLTVFLGLSGLLVFDYMMLRSIGIGGALVVGTAVLSSLTLLPAALFLLGPRVNALAIPRLRPQHYGSGFWSTLSRMVSMRPRLVFLAVLALLVLLGTPFLRVRMGAPDVTILPADVESRRGFDLLRSSFSPGEIAPILVVVEAPGPILEREPVGALYDFTQAVAQLPSVVRVDSIVSLDPSITKAQYQLLYSDPRQIADPQARQNLELLAKGRVALVSVVTAHNPATPEAKALVRAVRAQPIAAGLQKYTVGAAAELMDVVDDLYTVFPRALLLILVTTYIALLLLFRSVVLPAKAVLMNTLSILASYGALVIIFQDGHLSNLLGFTPEGVVDATTPIVMFCVLFGLSMDYEVFVLSRIKEAYDTCQDNTHAVALGLERTGRIITSAALIIVIVAGSFAFAHIVIIKALGIGIALAILIDATVVRALLVPATMQLLGRWNWWAPRWLQPKRPY